MKGDVPMLFDNKKQVLHRALAGALLGLAAHALMGRLAGDFPIAGPDQFTGYGFLDCGFPDELEGWGVALSFALFALLGAEVGVATLPFAGEGRILVLRTLAHFALTAGTMALWAGLTFDPAGAALLVFLLAVVYVLVWLGRWVGWYAELDAIRAKLGLSPGPSPMKWRETLPYLPFAALLCLLLPLALRLFDGGYVPVLSGLLYPYILLPAGAFCSALSLGRRRGFCPLYPAACVLGILVFIPLARLFSNMYDWPLVTIALACSLAGDLAGAALRRVRKGGAGV